MITVQNSQFFLSGEVTQATAARHLQQGILLLKQHTGAVTLDLSQITLADSTVVSLLAHFSRACAAKKIAFSTKNIPPKVQNLLALYGLNSLLTHT